MGLKGFMEGVGFWEKTEEEEEGGERMEDIDPLQEEQEIRIAWSIHAVAGFVKNINPNFIRARRERARADAMKEANSTNWANVVMILGMFLIIASIAYVIIQSGAAGDAGSAVKNTAGSSISLLFMRRFKDG